VRKFVLVLVPLVLIAADDKPAAGNGAGTAGPASQAQTAPIPGLPAGAVQDGANSYRYTDKAGKVWIYQRTPFGWSKTAEPSIAQTSGSHSASRPIPRVTDLGASVRFEVQGLMGKSVRERPKDQLNADEKAWFEQATAASNTEKQSNAATH
jgi:hypothetical protein